MLASDWTPLVVTMLGISLVLLVAIAGGGFLFWRWTRRRLRLLRAGAETLGVTAAWDYFAVRRNRRLGSLGADQLRGRSASRLRNQVHVAVELATSSTAEAVASGASVAELPELSRRLGEAGAEVERVLGMCKGLAKVPDEVINQVAELLMAARDVQGAAVVAATDTGSPRVQALSREAGDELRILDAGLSAARKALDHLSG